MSVGSRRHPVIIAAMWMLGAITSFIAMALGGRQMSDSGIGTFEILLCRSLVGLVIVTALVARTGWGQLATRRFRLHLVRNVGHFCGQFGWFTGIALIPLAEVFAIEFTTPMWTALIAAFLLAERITRARLTAIACGFIGILIILRPGLAVIQPGALAVVGAAIGFAISYVFTRKLAPTDSPLSILFYMTVIQTPLALFPAVAHWVPPPPHLWPWVLAIGVAGLSAHYCMTRALTLADATVVVTMDFLRLPLIAVAGFVFYGEPLDWLVLVGATVMLAGNVTNIAAERARLPHHG